MASGSDRAEQGGFGDEELELPPPAFVDAEAAALVDEISADVAQGENPDHPIRVWLRGIREKVDRAPYLKFAYKVFIALVGGVIVLAGIIMLVTPGPGWLAIFLGLAVLGTEFHWAKRVSNYAKRQLTRFWTWWKARREAKRWRRARKAAQKRRTAKQPKK
jgi:uncharacterized protein (TIGR02611 family)